MSFTKDLVKIHLINEGYLPNYPYHLISDEEMCDAFINEDEGYFFDEYPLLSDKEETSNAYKDLVNVIKYFIAELKLSKQDSYELPNWIYSYMLGRVISVNSDILDIHDLIYPLGVDNIEDIFDARCEDRCLEISKLQVSVMETYKLKDSSGNYILGADGDPLTNRPPTIFGEPHIIKYIRVNIL